MAKRLPSIKTLRNKADRAFSIFIRFRDACLEGGQVACCTCGVRKYWEDMDCGHYVKRQHFATRYDERNAAPQCRKCNRFMGGNMDEFAHYLTRRYGCGILDELMKLKRTAFKMTREDYQNIIDFYGATSANGRNE